MENLFGNNLIMIFVIAAIAIITYTNFTESQRFFLLYLLAYGTAYFQILRIYQTVLLLVITTFVYLEYLTEDKKKIEVVVNVFYKIGDYLYMMFFQYHVLLIALSFVLLWLDHKDALPWHFCVYLSWISLYAGEHLTISQPFKVATVTQILKAFESKPIYDFYYTEAMQRKFDLLCAFEDKSYFERKNSYSIVSLEYIRYVLQRIAGKMKGGRALHHRIGSGLSFVKRNLSKRGYSTPEMQLLRNLAVVRGYDKHKFSRKIYEILYSKILFSSLKSFYERNTYRGLEHYRHYLLYVYVHTVPVRIHKRKYTPMVSVFKNRNFWEWTDEAMFVACLGLCFRDVSETTLQIYDGIIQDFLLDERQIRSISSTLKPAETALPV